MHEAGNLGNQTLNQRFDRQKRGASQRSFHQDQITNFLRQNSKIKGEVEDFLSINRDDLREL